MADTVNKHDQELNVQPEAVEEAASSVEETPAQEVVAEQEEQQPVLEEVAESQAVVEAPVVTGFTGEPTRVLKLEELEQEIEGPKAEDDLFKLYEETMTSMEEEDVVTGVVVSVTDKDVVIDIGFKSDAIVPRNEFEEDVEPGQEVEVYIERLEDRQGQPVVSRKKAVDLRRWQRIERAYETGEVVEGEIVRRVKGGMIVSILDTEAFLPGSQVDVRPVRDFDAYIGKRMEFRVVKINPLNGNVVVSHKVLIEKELEEQRKEILSKMEPGQVLEGTVKNITDFGVFIDLGGVDGLLHITDLSWGRVKHPSEVVQMGQKLNVVVLEYDKERQRISLGLKQLQPHPWDNIDEKYKEGDVVEGRVVSITDYGAFVELEKGIEGLVHISEMSWTEHIKHPSQKVQLGQTVKVKILSIDKESKKISLGMKQLEPNPWEDIAERYPPGTVLRGTVRNLTNFGVFVELEPGIDGLVHISDLSWTRKVRHPGELVKKGQELDVVVLDIDMENRRISLGHKQVQTNPWTEFAVLYAEGTDTTGKVVRFTENGIVVELPHEVEGFVPASELKKSAQRFEDAYQIGDELELRVIRFDETEREIILSETAKERAEKEAELRKKKEEERRARREEQEAVKKYIKSANTGPATLAELSDLEALKAQLEAQEKEAAEAKAKEEQPEASEEAASEEQGEKED